MSSTKRKIDDQAYRFEVVGQDLTFELRPDHNLIHLMSVICDQWLNNARDGDGGVFDHMWIVKTLSGLEFTAPYNDRGEDHEGETKLNDLDISPGDMLSITYDMGSTTYFAVKFVSIENVASNVELPRRVMQLQSRTSDIYTPPEGSPDLNEVFPHANELLFGQSSVAKWIAPFQCSKTCGGFVEAGPNAMGDVGESICFVRLFGDTLLLSNDWSILISHVSLSSLSTPQYSVLINLVVSKRSLLRLIRLASTTQTIPPGRMHTLG